MTTYIVLFVKKDKIPVVLEKCKDKLPEHAKVNDLIDQWSILDVADNLLDLAGSFIPEDKNVHAAPNGRRFILRPTEHSAFHSKPSSTTGKSAIINVSTNKLVPNEKGTIRTEQSVARTSKDKSTKVTLKNNHQLKLMHIGNLLDPKIKLTDLSKDRSSTWSKTFCLKTVHTGVNKLISNTATIEMYDTVIEGVREYHSTILAGAEINNKKIAPPSKVVLDKDKIHVAQSALLKSYQNDTGETNPYQDLRSYYGKLYSLMHGGIQKFAKELNGAYVRILSSSTTSTISLVPWSSAEIPRGSLSAKKLVSHLIHLISSIRPVKENANVSVLNHMSNQGAENSVISPSPPQCFKCCKLLHIDNKKIQLEIEDWPVGIMVDGCATNIAASNQLTEYLGFLSPSIRCVVYAADGSVKRMSNSKTMNFPDLSAFFPTQKLSCVVSN